jgi:3-hydroxyacyl-[acyl-carrier-protein] dehydratase
METLLELADIQRILPHRYPFLLVDRVMEVELDKRLVAIKNVTSNEPFFVGHFPGFPVMPGVLIIEAMAQACALLALYGKSLKHGEYMLFAGIDEARFRQQVVPGDTLRLTIEMLRNRARSAQMRGVATVEGKGVVAEAVILSLIGTQSGPSPAAQIWLEKKG